MKIINDRYLATYMINKEGVVINRGRTFKASHYTDKSGRVYVNLFSSADRKQHRYYIDELIDLTFNTEPWYTSDNKTRIY